MKKFVSHRKVQNIMTDSQPHTARRDGLHDSDSDEGSKEAVKPAKRSPVMGIYNRDPRDIARDLQRPGKRAGPAHFVWKSPDASFTTSDSPAEDLSGSLISFALHADKIMGMPLRSVC